MALWVALPQQQPLVRVKKKRLEVQQILLLQQLLKVSPRAGRARRRTEAVAVRIVERWGTGSQKATAHLLVARKGSVSAPC